MTNITSTPKADAPKIYALLNAIEGSSSRTFSDALPDAHIVASSPVQLEDSMSDDGSAPDEDYELTTHFQMRSGGIKTVTRSSVEARPIPKQLESLISPYLRDDLFYGWSAEDKAKRVAHHVASSYVGAVAPQLLEAEIAKNRDGFTELMRIPFPHNRNNERCALFRACVIVKAIIEDVDAALVYRDELLARRR